MSSATSWFDDVVNVGASSSRATAAQLPASAQHVVSFAEEYFDDDDRASVSSEKSPPSEGLKAVL